MGQTRNENINRSNNEREVKKEEIRNTINATLGEMEITLDKLKSRLTPEEIKHRTKERMKKAARDKVETMKDSIGGTMKEYTGTIRDTVNDNKIPAALAGVSIGWMIFSSIKEKRERRQGLHYPHECYTFYNAWTGEIDRECPPEEQGKLDDLKEKAASRKEEFKDQFTRGSEHVRHQISDTADSVRHRAADWQSKAQRQAERAREGMSRQMRMNPLSVGMVALAAGALIGLLVPESRWEDRAMGEKRDDLMHQAKERGAEKLEQAKHAAQESKETFKEEMKSDEKKEKAPV